MTRNNKPSASSPHHQGEKSPLLVDASTAKKTSTLGSLFQDVKVEEVADADHDARVVNYDNIKHQTDLRDARRYNYQDQLTKCSAESKISIATGSLTFLLYHVVYCLAQASTITRPHADHSSVGVMAKMAAVGTLFAGPVFVWELGIDVPAIYPASDLFLSPFLAQVAADIDASLYEHGLQNDDRVFLATFGALSGLGFMASGLLCIMAARIKLANLGSFLPYCVLCGFFTTIGVLIWSLGFSVDTGMKVGEMLHYRPHEEGESWMAVFSRAILHHAPSFIVGVIMHIVAQKNSLYVIGLIFATLFGSYAMLWITGTSLEQAQEQNWFFSSKELQDPSFQALSSINGSWWDAYTMPAPFAIWKMMIFDGSVHWPSFKAGIPTMSSLAFLYLIRCSLHTAALKKNIPNVTRKAPECDSPAINASIRQSSYRQSLVGGRPRQSVSLPTILESGYGYSQIWAALAGGIAVAPALGSALTLFKLGCEGVGPQYGSILLISVFYLTDFQLVQYIPKPAVSCLMVLASIDMCKTWLVSSYLKTKSKLEWMVAPMIVVLAFTVGMLNAILIGVAVATFIFVAHFYKAGTVKFVGNGLNLQSTVERGIPETKWLNNHGNMIQILVLQNYLFFGNAQSVLQYVMTMFEEPNIGGQVPGENTMMLVPPPKYVVIDFTIATGMDTSATDILREITEECKRHRCKLFFSGLSPDLRDMLVYAKLGPSYQKRTLLFAPDLESALAKAEDGLITRVSHLSEAGTSETHSRLERNNNSGIEDGFLYALQKIDDQHGLDTLHEIAGLFQFLVPIELDANQILPWGETSHHGLYFIEYGQLRLEHSSDYMTNKTFPSRHVPSKFGALSSGGLNPLSNTSISHLNARSTVMGYQVVPEKKTNEPHDLLTEQHFRLARIGPGWVVGMIEECSGMRRAGVYISVTPCRLHHLPYDSMKKIEKSDPKLMMNLYKLMSSVSLKRQELTIGQLSQFVSIMQSPSPKAPASRSTLQ